MKSSVKIYIHDMKKNPSYLFIVIFFLAVTINSLLSIRRSALESGMPEELRVFTFQYLFLVLIIGYFLFLVMVCISSLVVSDKVSGRCEMLLANRVSIGVLVRSYRQTVFLLCILPIFIFVVLFCGISFFYKIDAILDMLTNGENLVFIFCFMLFMLSLIEMIIYICLVIKNVEIIRSILSFASIAFLFLVMAPVSQMRERGWILDGKSLALAMSAVLFVLSMINLSVIFHLKRYYSNERITLSFHQ